MADNIIASDGRLSEEHEKTLTAILETIIPSDDDDRFPSAAEVGFVEYLERQDPDFFDTLISVIESLGDDFVSSDYEQRYLVLSEINQNDQSSFNALIRHIYTSYYEDDRVMIAIGAQAGPPFPRGNTIEAGDLSLLDPVTAKPRSYRK